MFCLRRNKIETDKTKNQYKTPLLTDNNSVIKSIKEILYMKATGIVRRIDDLGRVVIPKEIRRTMKIREGEAFWIHIDVDFVWI